MKLTTTLMGLGATLLAIAGVAAYSRTLPQQETEFIVRTGSALGEQDPRAHDVPDSNPSPARFDYEGLTVYGNIIYSNAMPPSDYGIYYFTTDDMPSGVIVDGSTYQSGVYNPDLSRYITVMAKPGSSTTSIITFYDTDTWTVADQIEAPRSSMAHDMTYCPADGKIYGCFLTESGMGRRLGTLNPATGHVTTIKDGTRKYCTMAANDNGELYAIDEQGNLYNLARGNGAETLIGNTGFEPYYEQSMTFDHNGRLLWFATNRSDSKWLEVNTATAETTVIADWAADMHEIVGAAILDEAIDASAPAAVSDLSANFPIGAPNGTVSFTMPSQTFGGETLNGTVNYTVKADGTVLREGEATAGSAVSISDISLADGPHRIEAVCSNNAGKGPKAAINVVVGYDTPKSPSEVTVTRSEGNATVSWTAVTEGINGGTTGDVKYNVTRLPDNVQVAENISGTNVTDNTASLPYAAYSYQVRATNTAGTSDPTISSSVILGYAIALPYTSDFSKDSCNSAYVSLNVNEDQSQWLPRPASKYWYCMGNVYNDADDWLFSPMVNLQADWFYPVSIDAQSTPSHNTELMDVYFGNDTTATAMTNNLAGKTLVYQKNQRRSETFYLHAPATGRYTVGLHCVSTKNQYTLLLHSLKIGEGINGNAPDTCKVTATPGEKGALSAKINVTPPAKNLLGNSVEPLTYVKIENITTGKTVGTKEMNGSTEAFTVTDTETVNGFNTWRITAANSIGEGRSSEVTAYVGIDTPALVTGLTFEQNGLDAVLTWDRISETGAHSGYVDPEQVFYRIVLQRPSITLIAAHVDETTFTDQQWREQLQSSQQQVAYAVFAENSIGRGEGLVTDYKLFGTPYPMPFNESFANKSISTSPWVNHSMVEGSTCQWDLAKNDSRGIISPQDNDAGFAIFRPGNSGSQILYSPMVDLTQAEHPALKFWYWTPAHGMSVRVSTDRGVNWETVDTLALTEDAWRLHTVDLSAYKGQLVSVGIQATVEPGDNTEGGLDNLSVVELDDTDLMAWYAFSEDPAVAGSKININLGMVNNGAGTINNYQVKILNNDAVIAEREISETLEADKTASLTIPVSISPATGRQLNLKAVVTTEGDSNADNNMVELNLDVHTPNYGIPASLTATREADNFPVKLAWEAPSETGSLQVTEDFENITPWQLGGINPTLNRKYSVVGNYRLFDGDQDDTNYLLYYPTPVAALPMAGCVYSAVNPQNLFETVYIPFNGDQCWSFWAAMDNPSDDYLILPELGSVKKISFYAKSVSRSNEETIELCASSTSYNIEDMTVVPHSRRAVTAKDMETDNGYTFYEFELPADTKYVAIHYVSEWGTGMLLDNLSYYPADGDYDNLDINGYNIYRNNEYLATSSDRNYEDATAVATVDNTYYVTALYGENQSLPSQEATVYAGSGINGTATGSLTISTQHGTITVYGSTADVQVYDMGGRLLATAKAADVVTIAMEPGIYNVRCGNRAATVQVR